MMNKVQENLFKLIQYTMGYPRVQVKDIAVTQPGARIVRAELDETGTIPVYGGSLIPLGYHTVANRPADTTFVIIKGNAADVGYSREPFFAGDGCLCLIPDEKYVSSRFLYHAISARRDALLPHVRKFGVSTLPRWAVEDLKISVPDLEEQKRVTAFLDYYADVSLDGLKKEAALRRKQQEYYRDRLLELLKETTKCQ